MEAHWVFIGIFNMYIGLIHCIFLLKGVWVISAKSCSSLHNNYLKYLVHYVSIYN